MSKSVTLYWRPGCGFCANLERQLVRREVAFHKINIWDDPDAAAFVRSVANGNEVVPTITFGDASLVNPSADEVVELIAQ